jgi:hypothetical protein
METSEVAQDEEEDDEYGSSPTEISPELDPRALPKSVGLSFVVAGQGKLSISICVTWARYRKEQNCWQRYPFSHIKRGIAADSDSTWTPDEDPGIALSLKQVRVASGTHVSLYLVNSTKMSGDHPKVDELIFQPQIRVLCDDQAQLVPIRRQEEEGHDPESLSLLYSERYAMARGHMCGAVWRGVDPEHTAPNNWHPDKLGPPFGWIDGEILTTEDRRTFTNPHCRTEYLPAYAVEQAALNGPPPGFTELAPENLADLWQTGDFDKFLMPILDEYEEWIAEQKLKIKKLTKYRDAALRNVDDCERALGRMRSGLDILRVDQDARMAFCFMNRAMHLQSLWKSGRTPLRWHLFQIAFILQCITGIVREDHPDRLLCDLLWLPTGAGKTEAYLGLAAFTMALRRRTARRTNKPHLQAGVTVVSRYTLRLLTIQQFRRAISVVTACEYLRSTEWCPEGYTPEHEMWGSSRFSVGLWVGAGVTPNNLLNYPGYDRTRKRPVVYLGAIGELYGRRRWHGSTGIHIEGEESEPAQVLNCPACRGVLAVSPTTFTPGVHEIHWIVTSKKRPTIADVSSLKHYRGIAVQNILVTPLPNVASCALSVTFTAAERSQIGPEDVDTWWEQIIKPAITVPCEEEFARASRPGYFFRHSGQAQEAIDFEIHCPNPKCELNAVEWSEIPAHANAKPTKILAVFSMPGKQNVGHGIPIPAYTVDDQIYSRCPSMIVATVDKFARLAFEPRASALFGNVNRYEDEWGYFRETVVPHTGTLKLGTGERVSHFNPPSLIIQDELHLIEGPLGTMVGIYETAIEILCDSALNGKRIGPKYVASTATVRQARSQVLALFNRELFQFPPSALTADDSFFAISREPHQSEGNRPGRLYIGVCAPGRGGQTPIIRIWSAILNEMAAVRAARGPTDFETDQFWTLVGYFNSKRELAGAVGLLRADIPERLRIVGSRTRSPNRQELEYLELSGRTQSFDIPGKLDRLSKFPDNDVDVVFATSMFGTGVDVDRLGLMVVNGQPKTTGNYIQATGRVGRQTGGLVITFLRASRPRDLDHYEFFVGYHRSLLRYVEPITVYPFSPRARERGLGPLSVAILRNAGNIFGTPVSEEWAPEDRITGSRPPRSGSRAMATRRHHADVRSLIDAIEERSRAQPAGRNPGQLTCAREASSYLDKWESFARQYRDLVYHESTMTREPRFPVVLGDPGHELRNPRPVFKNAPQSLRDVEATTTFDDEA